ncbi:hypothetical protein SLOPH_709 [Spraguea lophii 42_110]|uniref:Phosphatidic acid phosphatase type 2/haloperoxidase domain-containing protein n=1 Tax=Spraguea lophii (strain 42_110) TaxID=1358809 RepID=S7WCV6_SPRLO|nr:hypothetical protein SLOPH_709 [Spraguea lophii 42_110]
MLCFFDIFFTLLPPFIFIYHLYFMLFSSEDLILVYKMIISFLFALFIKQYSRSERHSDKYYIYRSKYSFPSTHSIFYTLYILNSKNIFIYILCSLGIYSRLFFKHHTNKDVLCGIVFAMVFDRIYNTMILKH